MYIIYIYILLYHVAFFVIKPSNLFEGAKPNYFQWSQTWKLDQTVMNIGILGMWTEWLW